MFILFCTSSKFSLVCIEWFDFLQRYFCKYISSEFIFKHVYIWSIRCFVSAISHICHFARAFLQREKKRNNDDRIPYKIFNWYFSMNAYKRCHYERAMTLSYSVLSGYLLQNTHTHKVYKPIYANAIFSALHSLFVFAYICCKSWT